MRRFLHAGSVVWVVQILEATVEETQLPLPGCFLAPSDGECDWWDAFDVFPPDEPVIA